MEKDTYITNQSLTKAWENWLYYHRGMHADETEDRFFNYLHTLEQSFIDDCLDWSNDEETYHVCSDTAQRVILLASSNFNVILNVYYINHPWK